MNKNRNGKLNNLGRNLTLLTDFYELTMMQAIFNNNMNDTATFDVFYRKNPHGNGFVLSVGAHSVIEYIENLRVTPGDINYLRSKGCFTEEFLEYLANFKFTGNIKAVPEGTVVFPGEVICRVETSILEANLIEGAVLCFFNHQSLIATKAARITYFTKKDGDIAMEFGLRRAQGPDAAILGTRAAVIAGFDATSNVLAGETYGIPVSGTHAHSWIMCNKDEETAFRRYVETFSAGQILLVDTYDAIAATKKAIKIFLELKANGKLAKVYGIRLDSGDLAALSIAAKKLFDEAGLYDVTICASNDLDEYKIKALKAAGAKINSWGIGTMLITSFAEAALGGVYKLANMFYVDLGDVPKIKLSESPEKTTNPGKKKVYRVISNETGKFVADMIMLDNEELPTGDFDIMSMGKDEVLKSFKAGTYKLVPTLVDMFVNGECVYQLPDLMTVKENATQQMASLEDKYRRIDDPEVYPVGLTRTLRALKDQLMNKKDN